VAGTKFCRTHKKKAVPEEVVEQDSRAALVVADSANVQVLTNVIEAAGDHKVTATSDIDEASELIRSRQWAFAIVELVLSGKDGIKVIRAGRKEDPDLPIMFVSARSNPSLIEAAFRAGANHELTTPIDPQDVLTQILGYTSSVDLDRAPTVLVLGARPGDVEMGCGGILCKHRSEGHRIAIVNLAGGGDPDSDIARTAGKAAKLLDATVVNFGDESHRIPDLGKAMAAFQKVLGESEPGMLYIPTLASDRPSSVQIHKIAVGLGDAVPNIMAYQDPGSTVAFQPRLFIDLAPQIGYKLELVELYDKFGFRNVGSDLVKATALYWGRFTRSSKVEPLEIIRRRHI
jgi:CheY-like chemotaxis protein